MVLCGLSNTRVSPDVFISRFTIECVQSRSESLGRHPVSRVVQSTLGKYAALSVGVDQVGNLVLSVVADHVGNLEFSCCVSGSLSLYEGE